jgi:hypothetical protein
MEKQVKYLLLAVADSRKKLYDSSKMQFSITQKKEAGK